MATQKFFLSAILFSTLIGCSPQSFSGATADPGATAGITGITPTTPQTCTSTNVQAMARMTKIVFVVDASGSNAGTTSYPATPSCNNGYGECVLPASDPAKAFRGGAISSFLNRYKAKTNFWWSFMTFAGDAARSFVNNGSDATASFTHDPNVMQYALNSFYAQRDGGQTPYRPAIDLAARAIVNDPDLRSDQKPNYFVVLLTDGFPTDYYDASGRFRSAALESDIDSLLSIAPGQVSLSTIFYGPSNDPTAISLLKLIAAKGKGQFASVNVADAGFKIDDVIPGATTGCP